MAPEILEAKLTHVEFEAAQTDCEAAKMAHVDFEAAQKPYVE